MEQRYDLAWRQALWGAWDRFDQLLAAAADRIPCDPHGHAFRLDEFTLENVFSEMGARLAAPGTTPDPRPLVAAMERGQAVPPEQAMRFLAHTQTCEYCDQAVTYRFDGRNLWTDEPCALGADPQPFEAFLNVPSGRLVLANDLTRDLFRAYGEFESIGTVIGRQRLTRVYERMGCFHVRLPDDGRLRIHARKGGDPDRNLVILQKRYKRRINTPRFFKGRPLAVLSIETRSCSLVDADEFVRWGGSLANPDIRLVSVDPGVYRLTHRAYRPDFGAQPEPETLTLIDWVRPPDPVVDHRAEYQAFQLTAGQVLWRALQRRHDDGAPAEDALWGIVDTLFSQPDDWHPNGFGQLSPESRADDPEVTIPPLTKRLSWYGARRSGMGRSFIGRSPEETFANALLIQAAIGNVPLNPSFRTLVRTVLRGIVEHGIVIDPFSPSPHDPPKSARQLADEAEEERRLVGIARQALDAMDLFEPDPALR